MIKNLLLILSFFFILPSVVAQTSANSYYRKMHNEQKKMMKKQIRFTKMLLLNSDPRRLDQGRDQIVTQIETSKKAIKKMPFFEGDSAYKKDYLNAFDLYHNAYTDLYDKAKETSGDGIETYEQMEKYLNAFTDMEIEIITADENVLAIEEYFVNRHNLELIDDGEVADTYETLMYLSEYIREVKLILSRVVFEADKVCAAYKKRQFDTIPRLRVAMVKAADFAMSDMVKLGDFDGDDDLYKDVTGIIEDLKEMGEKDMVDAVHYLQDADWNEKAEARGSKIMDGISEDVELLKEDIQSVTERFVYSYVPE